MRGHSQGPAGSVDSGWVELADEPGTAVGVHLEMGGRT